MAKNENKFNKALVVLGLVTILGIVLFLNSNELFKGKTKSAELRAMEAFVPTIKLVKGQETKRYFQDDDLKPFIGKPKFAEYEIEYEPKTNYTKEDVYQELINTLSSNNWQKEELASPQYGYYRTILPKKGFTLLAKVYIHPELNIVRIVLNAYPSL